MVIITEKIQSNQEYTLITIKNTIGFEAKFLDCGAAIYSIGYYGKDGNFAKVTDSCKDFTMFAMSGNCYGKVVGPVAGRIKDATATLNGVTYNFDKNNGVNVLHSGSANLAYKVWNYEIKASKSKIDLIFSISSKDMDGGFPGNISYKVTYTITEGKKEINAKFYAKPDRPAFISLTNHIYFNLNGGYDRIFDQELYVRDYKVAEMDNGLIVQKWIDAPEYLDFSTPVKLGKKITHPALMAHGSHGLDHPFKFNEVNKNKPAATLYDSKSKRKVTIYTSFPGIVIYGDNWPDKLENQAGVTDEGNYGLAMETEIVTNNTDEFVFTPEKPFSFVTKYKFN